MDIGTFPLRKIPVLMHGPKWQPRNTAYGNWINQFQVVRKFVSTIPFPLELLLLPVTKFRFAQGRPYSGDGLRAPHARNGERTARAMRLETLSRHHSRAAFRSASRAMS